MADRDHIFRGVEWEPRARLPRLGEANARSRARGAALNGLCRQILNSAAPEVPEARWTCWTFRALGKLASLCSASCIQMDNERLDLAQVFDRVTDQTMEPELRRLAAIYDRRLGPVVALHFTGSEREQLERALKSLMLLQFLGVPYRSGCPTCPTGEAGGLLTSLYILCRGIGLMMWREGGEPVYVVETDRGRFVEWVVARMTGFLGERERDKTVSDAVWSALFPIPECGARQERWWSCGPSGSRAVQLSGEALPGREAVWVRRPGLGERVLAFESVWKADRGRRVQRVMRKLPDGISSRQVWVWVPRHPSREEAEPIARYMATARALRHIAAHDGAGGMGGANSWAMRALQRRYVRVSAPALTAILNCYREGQVVTDEGVWQPEGRADSLVQHIGELVAWAERSATLRFDK